MHPFIFHIFYVKLNFTQSIQTRCYTPRREGRQFAQSARANYRPPSALPMEKRSARAIREATPTKQLPPYACTSFDPPPHLPAPNQQLDTLITHLKVLNDEVRTFLSMLTFVDHEQFSLAFTSYQQSFEAFRQEVVIQVSSQNPSNMERSQMDSSSINVTAKEFSIQWADFVTSISHIESDHRYQFIDHSDKLFGDFYSSCQNIQTLLKSGKYRTDYALKSIGRLLAIVSPLQKSINQHITENTPYLISLDQTRTQIRQMVSEVNHLFGKALAHACLPFAESQRHRTLMMRVAGAIPDFVLMMQQYQNRIDQIKEDVLIINEDIENLFAFVSIPYKITITM